MMSVFLERLNLPYSCPVDSASIMSYAILQQLRHRELGKNNYKVHLVQLDLTGVKIKLSNLQQPQSQLISETRLKIKENKEIINETVSVLQLLSGLSNLEFC